MLSHLPHFATLIATNPVFHTLGRIFAPLVDLLRGILRGIHSVIGSWGWAIIILTIIVRLILMPLTFKQFRSAQAMQKLQPKIKELQRKYKNDKRKLQEETMKLYQEYRVNPFASCLPLLLQMPIFISLYYAIRFTPEIRTSSFWIIPSLGLRYLPLFVIYIASQVVSTELMMQPETEKQQKYLMRLMPVMFIFILYRFPAGLMLYWVTTNLWTIGQQVIIRRTAPKQAPEPLGAKPPGRFMRALTQAQAKAADGQPPKAGAGSARSAREGGGKSAPAKSSGARQGGGKSGAAKSSGARQGGGKTGAAKSSAPRQGDGKTGGDRPAQKRSGQPRPAGKGGTPPSGKRPSRPSGASDGPKRKPTS
jgi:YidC/Oxa1 family membrane protein insertase